jgi:outer membrane protein assembly complex protein YaeT
MRARSAISRRLAAELALVLALTLTAVTLAGAGRAQDQRAAETPPPPGPVVREISFQGVKALKESDLAERLFTRARPSWKFWADRPPFDEPTLEGDMQRIAATYREFGHYRARATYRLTWDETGNEARIAIDVEEGPLVRLQEFSVDLGELPEGEARWRKVLVDSLPLKKGDPFTVAVYGGAKRALLQKLADYGYPDAALSGGGEVDVATDTATIEWAVHPGPRVIIGEIRVTGQKTVSPDIIERELTIKPGDVYSDKKIQESQRHVSDLGLFRSVLIGTVIEPDAPPPEGPPPGKVTRPISVSVDERPLHSVRLGLGYGTEDKVRAQAGWLHRNVFGRADTFDIHARYSSLTSEFQATLREPHVPDMRTTLWLDSRIRDDTLPAYDDVALLGRATIERPLRLGWSGEIGYGVEFTNVRKVASDDPAQIEQFRLGYLALGVRRITADSLVEPTKGTWLETSLETASNWVGSQKDYVRWTVDGRGFLPLGPTVFAGRVMVGTISAFSHTTDAALPVTKLFYAGGSATVRGYDFQHLGTDDAQGRAIGGASLLLGSLEWRFPVWRELRGATFVDAGQLSKDSFDWKPENLRTSVGAGLRYSTPLGPVRVDIAAPLDPPHGVDHVRFWFAIGQPF